MHDASFFSFVKKKNGRFLKELHFSVCDSRKNYNSLNVCCKVNFNERTIIFFASYIKKLTGE